MALRKYNVDRVLEAYKFCRDNMDGGALWVGKVGYGYSSQLFNLLLEKGTDCKVCGAKAVHFIEQRINKKLHLKLVTNRGSNSYITIDHTIPKTIGGSNAMANKEPLCTHCNSVWKSKFDLELKRKVIGQATGTIDEYLIIIE